MLSLLIVAAAVVLFGSIVRMFVGLGRRRTGAVVLASVAVVGVLYVIASVRCVEQDKSLLIDEIVDGQRRLRHPMFDFALPHPGPSFTTDVTLSRGLEHIPGATCYGFAARTGELLAVCGIVHPLHPGEAFRDDFNDAVLLVRRGIARALSSLDDRDAAFDGLAAKLAETPATNPSDDTVLELGSLCCADLGDRRGDGGFYLTSGRIHLRIMFFTVERGIALIVAASPNGDTLADVVNGFSHARP